MSSASTSCNVHECLCNLLSNLTNHILTLFVRNSIESILMPCLAARRLSDNYLTLEVQQSFTLANHRILQVVSLAQISPLEYGSDALQMDACTWYENEMKWRRTWTNQMEERSEWGTHNFSYFNFPTMHPYVLNSVKNTRIITRVGRPR